MCGTCGCSDDATVTVAGDPGHRPDHDHGAHNHAAREHGTHDRTHEDRSQEHGTPGHKDDDGGRRVRVDGGAGRPSSHGGADTVVLEHDVLAKNDRLARDNRDWLAERGVCAVNLMSSPGSGKTTLLEHTVRALSAEMPVAVVEGDQATPLDAERIRATGCPTVQVNTGSGCHLDADMLRRALRTLDPPSDALVFVENVGNLVCPALFDLGERHRVVLASTTEGEDKPLKYPHMFRSADLVLLTKTDLLPHLAFDTDRFTEYLRRVNPRVEVFPVSTVTAGGPDRWHDWLRHTMARPPACAG